MTVLDESLSVQIVESIAEQKGIEPTEISYKLHDYVETDALRLLGQSNFETWVLTFEVPDARVTVTGTGNVEVDPIADVEVAPKETSTNQQTVD